MQVLVNSDNHIQLDQTLQQYVASVVSGELAHYGQHVTRAEVHLKDANSGKAGDDDKHCTIEVRPQGHQPLAVTAKSDNLRDAITSAAEKMHRALSTVYGRIADGG